MNTRETHTVDPLSFLLGMYAGFSDQEEFVQEFKIDPKSTTKQWLKHFAALGKTIQSFGGDMGFYLAILGFIPEETLTDIMKDEFLLMEEQSKERPKTAAIEKRLKKKVDYAGKAIESVLCTKLDFVTEAYVKGTLFRKEKEIAAETKTEVYDMTSAVVSVIEEPESEPKKEEPSVPKKSKEQEELDRLAFLWITGQYY